MNNSLKLLLVPLLLAAPLAAQGVDSLTLRRAIETAAAETREV